MIELRILGDEVGIGTNPDSGNPQVSTVDKKANMLVRIELTPEAWKAFVAAVPRLRGVGIPLAGMATPNNIWTPPDGNGDD